MRIDLKLFARGEKGGGLGAPQTELLDEMPAKAAFRLNSGTVEDPRRLASESASSQSANSSGLGSAPGSRESPSGLSKSAPGSRARATSAWRSARGSARASA